MAGDAFQGWFDGSMPDQPFVADVAPNAPLPFKTVTAWILSASQKSPLIELDYAPELSLKVGLALAGVMNDWNGATTLVSMIHGNEYARTDAPVASPSGTAVDAPASSMEKFLDDECEELFLDPAFRSRSGTAK